jgi:hypothetical protein
MFELIQREDRKYKDIYKDKEKVFGKVLARFGWVRCCTRFGAEYADRVEGIYLLDTSS